MKRTTDSRYIAPASNTANQTSSHQTGTASHTASVADVNARAAIDPRNFQSLAPSVYQAPCTPAGGPALMAGAPFMTTRPAIDPSFFVPIGSAINQTSSSPDRGTNISASTRAKATSRSANKKSTHQHGDGDSPADRPSAPKERVRRAPTKFGPISHLELETSLFNKLGIASQQQDRTLNIKLGEPEDCFNGLPMDIAKKILALITTPTDLGAWAASSRQNYLTVHEVHRFRRVTGISRDIYGISDRKSFRTTSSLRSMADHLAKDGTYDKLLLTPLSHESRLASGFTLKCWTENHANGQSASSSEEESLNYLVKMFSELSANAGMDQAMDSLINTIGFVNQHGLTTAQMKSFLDSLSTRLRLDKRQIQRLYFADLGTRNELRGCYHGTFDIASVKSLPSGEIALLCARNGISEQNFLQLVQDLPVESRWELLRESLRMLENPGLVDRLLWVAQRIFTVCAVIFLALDRTALMFNDERMESVLASVADAVRPKKIKGSYYIAFDRKKVFSGNEQRGFEFGFDRGLVGHSIHPESFVGETDDYIINNWGSKVGYTLGRLRHWLDSRQSTDRAQECFQTLYKAFDCETRLNQQ